MIQCAKGCTPPPDSGWVKGVTSAFCYTVCLWRAVHVHKCVDAQLHVSDPINLGIKVPVGDFDLWPNGGSQSSNCNQHNYFGDVVCSHVEAKLLFSATMRQNCHIARKCRDYRQYKSGRCGENISSPIGWNLVAKDAMYEFPNNYYMDTEFTSGDFCGVTDSPIPKLTTTDNPMTNEESSTSTVLNRGLKPVKELKRDDKIKDTPKYSKWCLGLSWFGLCKSKTVSKSNAEIKIQIGDISDMTKTKNEADTTIPSNWTTIQSTTEQEIVGISMDNTIGSTTSTSTSVTQDVTSNTENHDRKSKWCLAMSWFGFCVSKTEPRSTSTTTSTTTTTTTSTATHTYPDDYYNYY